MKRLKKLDRISVKWDEGIDIKFDIFTDSQIQALQIYFEVWVRYTKIYTPESFCRFVRKKNRKIEIFSLNQYLVKIRLPAPEPDIC